MCMCVCVFLSTRIQDCGHDIGIASAIFLTQHELGSIEIRLSFSAGRVIKMKLHLAHKVVLCDLISTGECQINIVVAIFTIGTSNKFRG
jgi:hypothetical protein